MKPRKVKEDDAPRTIACPHKVSAVLFITYGVDQFNFKYKNSSSLFSVIIIDYYIEYMHVFISIRSISACIGFYTGMNTCQVNMSRRLSSICSIPLSGMYQDVQGQLSDEEALAYPRASGARLCRMWQSLCGEFKTEEASTCTHRRETFPGEFLQFVNAG